MMKFFVESVSSLEQEFGLDNALNRKHNISIWGRKFLIKKIQDLGLSFDFHISVEEKGKPFFTYNNNIHFSISNTIDFVAIAISNRKVGIDIESTRKYKENLVKRYFHPNEYTFIQSFPLEQRDRIFTRLWTIKEAYVKMTGTGIANNFAEHDLSPDNTILLDQNNDISYQISILNTEIKSYYIPEYQLFLSISQEEN